MITSKFICGMSPNHSALILVSELPALSPVTKRYHHHLGHHASAKLVTAVLHWMQPAGAAAAPLALCGSS